MMKCFKIKSYNINNRLDPLFYSNDTLAIFSKSNFPKRYLGDIVKYFKTGFAAGKAEQSENQNDIIQIRPTNINENRQLIFQKNIYISRKTLPEKKQYLVQKREILFNNTNSQELVGKSVYFDLEGDFFCSNHITRMGVDEKIVNPIYLTYILNWMQENKVFYNTCTNWNNQSGINIELLKSYIVPLPSLNVQNEIVKIIQKAYTLKSQYEDEANSLLISLNNLVTNELNIKIPNTKFKQYFSINSQNILNNRIDPHYHQPKFSEIENYLNNCQYKQYKIGDIAIKISSGATPLSGGDAYTDSQTGIPFIRSGDINLYDSINYENILYIKENVHNTILKSSQLQFEDILVAIVGATIGQVSMYKNQNSANINQAIALIRVDKNRIIPEYLKIYLLSRLGQEELNRNKRPVARANLNLEEIANINILIPDFQTQQNIIDKFNNSLCEINQNFNEARKEFEQAKIKIEKMILGEE